MIHKIILFLLIITFFDIVIAQPSFFKNYGEEYSGTAFAFTLTSNGEYLLTGTNSGLWLFRVDSDGEFVWQTSFNGIYGKGGYAVLETTDGGFLAAGIQGKPDTQGHNYAAAYAVKTDEVGDSLWTFVWNEELDSRAQIRSVLQPNDSTYLLAGTTEAQINPDIPSQAILIALDTNGNERWTRIYDEYTHIVSAVHTSDGGYFLGGLYGLIYFPSTEPYVVKTDENGIILWEKRTGWNLPAGRVMSVIPAGDGGFMVCGTAIDGSYNRDIFVSKLDANGNLVWTQQYGGPEDDHATEIIANSHGSFTLAGYTSNNTSGEFDQYDIWLVNVDANGEVLWERSYGTEEADLVTGLRECSDGGFAIVGYHPPYEDSFLAKTDSLGNIDVFTSVFAPDLSALSLEAFPNPALDELTVVLPENLTLSVGNFIYTITDLSGKTIRRAAITRNPTDKHTSLSVSITDLPSGFYVISLNDGERTYAAKFVKQ